MGVKGAKNKIQQEAWNKFVSSLIKNAGLPSTCLVRLIFKNSEGITYEINNYDDLKELSNKYGIKNDNNYIQMNVLIEVLALTFIEYQKRFKYEQNKYMKKNNIKPQINNLISDKHKQILSKFVLSPLITTNAIIQKKSQSQSIDIMDMLNVNQNEQKENNNKDNMLDDLLKNVVNQNENQKKQQKLSTIYSNYPLMSFEELRYKYYINNNKWNNNKLIILNWPNRMNKATLQTIFSPYGNIINCEINNKNGIIEYNKYKSCEQAIIALNGFQIGINKLFVQFYDKYIKKEEIKKEEIKIKEEIKEEIKENNNTKLIIGNWPISMGNNLLKTLFSPYGELKQVKIINECGFVQFNTKEETNKAYNALNGFQIGNNKLKVSFNTNNNNNKQTPNSIDIEDMILNENENENETENENENKNENKNENENSNENLSNSIDLSLNNSESSDLSDSSFYDSSDSEIGKLKKKSLKKTLTKKELKKLKQKEKQRKKSKNRKRKKKKKIREREKYVDKSILALNECLDKFTNLMTSVSQSAMVMQQSVAQISQLHAQQQQQQSIIYQQSIKSLFPNQPMYNSNLITTQQIQQQQQQQPQPQPQPGSNNSNKQSMQNIITQLSQTQGAPDKKNISNNNNITASPILHSTEIVFNNNNNNNNNNDNNNDNSMNLSGDSNTDIQPGNNSNNSNNPSKSKIFEHKKALRNVSKEMDDKLNALNEMGYKNRTFNLVLLKQENGDMKKVIQNLKQFYQNN